MVTVRCQALTNNLGVNFCATRFSVFELFQNKNAAAFTENKTIAVFVVWA